MRYILMDNHSGYIWGDTLAKDPIDAARWIDEQAREYGRRYEECLTLATNETGYLVYVAPPDHPAIDDGQDEDQIAAVEDACELVARVKVWEAER